MPGCAGELLRTISLPCALHAVALDPTEHALYLGGSDGRVFDVSLVGPYPPERPPASQQQPAPANGHAPGFVFGHAGHDETVREMRGHSHAVRSLAVTPDGASLLSGELSLPPAQFHSCLTLLWHCCCCLRGLQRDDTCPTLHDPMPLMLPGMLIGDKLAAALTQWLRLRLFRPSCIGVAASQLCPCPDAAMV